MKKWLKVGAVLAGAGVLLMILAPRLWVKNSRAHLTIDGRVTDDFKLYFGPGGKLLLRIGEKTPRAIYAILPTDVVGVAEVRQCPTNQVLFPPFIALSFDLGKCPLAVHPIPSQGHLGNGGPSIAFGIRNRVIIRTDDRHDFDITWFDPPR